MFKGYLYVIIKNKTLNGDEIVAEYYIFEDTLYIFASSKNSDYIFQYITERKLSDVYHSHDFYECMIILDGICTQNINGEKYNLGKDSIILLSPSDNHSIINQSKDICIICVSVRAEEFEKLSYIYNFRAEDSEKVLLSQNISEKISAVFPDLKNLSGDYNYKLLIALIIKAFNDTAETEYKNMPKWLSFALKEMSKPENIKEGIPAMIRISNYSRSRLSNLINKYMEISLHEFILNLRLETACKELILTSKDIEEIGESVGYSSFSHFQKVFKEKYGITPAKLRRKHQTKTI